MGLLAKAVDRGSSDPECGNAVFKDVHTAIIDFHQKNPSFHCVVFRPDGGRRRGLSRKLAGMAACHGLICGDISGGNCLALLPGGLDMELFAHRLSKSSGSTVLFQFSANSSSLALETLSPYLR